MGTKVYDNALDLITFTRASSATYLDSDGLLKTATTNIPRIEYAADGTLKGLLVEEARTNLLLRSEEFDNAAWSSSLLLPFGSGSVANAAVAPDGTTSADLIVPTTDSANTHYIRSTSQPALATGVSGTFSVFVKAAGYTTLSLRLVNTDAPIVNYDLVAVSADSASGTISSVGNGWFRCTIIGVGTGSTAWPWIYPNQQAAYAGDGTSGIYVWGAQFEAGAFPTSYIPTAGATATRAADIASIPVSAFGYNQKAGSVVVDVDSRGSSGSHIVNISDGTTNNRMALYGNLNIFVASGGVSSVNASLGVPASQDFLASFAYKENNCAGSLSGAAVVSDTSAAIPTVSTVRIGADQGGTNVVSGHIKSIAYYPRRLSNAQLQELTS